jgi:O-antigen/teichoic acid export membrane protein
VQNPRGDDAKFLRTLWTIQVARGAVLLLGAVALSSLMASAYDQPELGRLIPFAGLSALIGGLASTSLLRLQRRMNVPALTGIDLASQAIALAAMIGWASVSPSVWALVCGSLAGDIAKTVISHALYPAETTGFGWEREDARAIVQFGKWILFSTMGFFLAGQADRLILGRLVSLDTLGVFGIAAALAALPTQVVWNIGLSVVLPTLSREAQKGLAGLRAAYDRMHAPILAAGGAVVVGIAATAPDLIALLYDDRYREAAWMLQLLSFGIWFQVPQTTSANALLAVGQPRWLAIGNWSKLAAVVVFLPAGYAFAGVVGAIAGLAAAEVFRYAVLALALRPYDLPAFRRELPATAVVLLAVGVGRVAGSAVAAFDSRLLAIAVAAAAALSVYVTATYLLFRSQLEAFWASRRTPAGAELRDPSVQ